MRWNVAIHKLLTGDFEAGRAGREARWPRMSWSIAVCAAALARGQFIDGKTILLYADEGLGDAIHYARYVPMLAARGARVVLEAPGALQRCCRAWLACRRTCCGLPRCRRSTCIARCPACPGVPHAARDDSGAGAVSAGRPAARARNGRRLGSTIVRIGLGWAGNPGMNDHNRSMPLHALSPMLDLDATFVSLQKAPRADDEALPARERPTSSTSPRSHRFRETAALSLVSIS